MRYVELHRQLQADYDEMMATERLKEDVERITRHDMKGPLAGVIGLVQGLSDASNLTDDQREQIRMVEETALQVLDMINLSNELYKIETGRFVLNPQVVMVAKIVRRIAEMVRRTFAVRNLTVAVATPNGIADEDLMAIGDSMLCYSLFQNLLKNACEAAPDNSAVTVTIYGGAPMRITVENRALCQPRFATASSKSSPLRESRVGRDSGPIRPSCSPKHRTEPSRWKPATKRIETRITLILPAE